MATIEFTREQKTRLFDQIQQYFDRKLDQEIGDL